jgi:5-histidylcysteine sulfoxide synthase
MPIRSLSPPSLSADRVELHDYFVDTWRLTELLFDSVRDEAVLRSQPDPLRNPLIFYLGHPAAFYVNKLAMAGLAEPGIAPRFEQLFARGVDPATPEQLGVAGSDYPPLEAVQAWRVQVRGLVLDALDRLPAGRPIGPDHPGWSLLMGLEHERIHFETSSMLLRQAPVEALRTPPGWQAAPAGGVVPAPRWIDVPGGVARIGRPDGHPLFGWDNEFGALEADVAPFAATRDLVSNAWFRRFVQDDGYRRPSLWTATGWSWRERVGATGPRFQVERDGRLLHRGVFELRPLPEAWPAEVNAHEAEAFCRWLGDGARLPTEAEHHLLAAGAPLERGDTVSHPAYNLDLRYCSPSPVDFMQEARSALGFRDVWGNVWQWLADDFAPLPGFAPHPLYPDFSEPWFDDEHAALIGGAWASTGTSASRFYRLWFRRHFFQHAGFRVARSA